MTSAELSFSTPHGRNWHRRCSLSSCRDGRKMLELRRTGKGRMEEKAGEVMLRTDYGTLVGRGGKAGLGTRELYQAISASPPEGSERELGQSDSNGFVASYDSQGRRVYHPVDNHPHS